MSRETGRTTLLICLGTALFLSQPAFSSTVIKATRGGVTLVGVNGDSDNRLSRVWFFPAEARKHGRACFGFQFNRLYQSGMNDRGLVFHRVDEGFKKWHRSPGKRTSKVALVELIMEDCATVEQALKIYDAYDDPSLSASSVVLADGSGDSAVVGFEEGELKVRRARAGDLACGFGQPIAEMRLKDAAEISKETVRSILLECLQRGPVATQYSCVYDPQKGLIFVSLLLKSKEELRFDLKEELSKGKHEDDLTELLRQILRKKLEKKTVEEADENPHLSG